MSFQGWSSAAIAPSTSWTRFAKPCSKINDALRAAVVKISEIGKQFVHLSAGHSQYHAT
jgi:hypothetical protein